MESILNIEISCFANYDIPANPKPVNLLAWLKSDKHFEKQKAIILTEDKAERNKLKAELPAITPSGSFTYRALKNLIRHSRFIQFDIDEKGNEHLGNYMALKSHICNIANVAYCGLSVSGKGFWGLIPIAHPEKHKQHFKALEQAFKKFNITIDPSCKDVSRLRGYSFDPDAYFNHNAKVFTGIYKEPVKKNILRPKFNPNYTSQNKIDVAVNMIHQAPNGEKHNTLLKAAKLMGGYIASGEVDEDAAVIAMGNAILNRDIDNFEAAKKTIEDGIKFGKNCPIEVSIAFHKQLHISINEKSQKDCKNILTPNKDFFSETKYIEIKEHISENWNPDIIELETFFETASLPIHPVNLNPFSTITNISLFIESHIATVKTNNGNRTFLPYLERLKELKNITNKPNL